MERTILLFKHDRKLLGLFSRSFYQALKEFFREASEDQDALPGVIISIQSCGRDPNSIPISKVWLPTARSPQMAVSTHCMDRYRADDAPVSRQGLLAEEKITHGVVDLLLGWRHPRFSVYRGDPVQPDDTATRERLASLCTRPSHWIDCTMTPRPAQSATRFEEKAPSRMQRPTR